jgi:lysophospholipase L1-like esterase
MDVAGLIPAIPAYGMTPANYPTFRAGVANAEANTAPTKILCIGTSIEAGNPATTNPGLFSVPAYLAAYLNANLCPTQLTGCAMAGPLSSMTNPDPRWSVGSGWTPITGFAGGGGWANNGYTLGTGATGNLIYTPANGSVDTFETYYIGTPSTGNLKTQIDAGTVNTHSTTNPNGIYNFSDTAAAATNHALTYTVSDVGAIALPILVDAFLSTQKGLRVANTGIPLLGTSGAWATTNGAYRSLEAIKAYGPQLTIIELGADDAGNSNSVASFLANLVPIVAACRLTGDVMFWTDPLCSSAIGTPPGNTLTFETAYNAAILPYCDANSIGVADIGTHFGAFTTWSANGFNADQIHPNAAGNQQIANAIGLALRSVL